MRWQVKVRLNFRRQKKGQTANSLTHYRINTRRPRHTLTHLFSVNTISRRVYSEGENLKEKRLGSERRHDSCSVSLCWDFSEGASERAAAQRKRWETDTPSSPCEWKQADGELSEGGIDGKSRGMRDEREKWQVVFSLRSLCPISLSGLQLRFSSVVRMSLLSRSHLSIFLCGGKEKKKIKKLLYFFFF